MSFNVCMTTSNSNLHLTQQGDNMAGLLFLFLMQAMDESFKKQAMCTSRTGILNPS
jgi:hypothetical protein